MLLKGRLLLIRWTAVCSIVLLISGCAALQGPPDPVSFQSRIDDFPSAPMPVEHPVEIRWSDRMVPFIAAKTDSDAAFALGMVHAHLRLGQMALARMITQGRISEMAGPWTTDIDAAIRAFDFGRAAPDIYAAMPPDTRRWMDRYVEGINHYAGQLGPEQWPHEFAIGDLEWEPWQPRDSIAIGRLSGIDINWAVWFSLLQVENQQVRNRVLARLDDLSRNGKPTFGESDAHIADLKSVERMITLATRIGKSGSNSFVIAPERSATGSALIASDPHLGFNMPNIWLIAGLRSPSYEVVGMMVPGTPVFGFGRTPHLAWGGTNLRATTSELVDVSTLTPDQIETVEHNIGVRLWFDETWQTRRTAYGPIVTGITELFGETPELAVNWVGHRITDETTALLGAMKARNFPEFRTAMKDFALPPQTFLVATKDGDIASMIATTVPARPEGDPLRPLVSPDRSARHFERLVSGDELPFSVNPTTGFLASANNRPTADESRPYGGIFPQDQRIRRIVQLLEQRADWTPQALMDMQMDTVSLLSLELTQAVLPRLQEAARSNPDAKSVLDVLAGWDGDYTVDSRAAPVFEAFIERFLVSTYDSLGTPDELAVYKRLGRERRLALDDLTLLDDAGWQAAMLAALPAAAGVAAKGTRWGDIHKINIGHILSRAPVIGNAYLERQIAVPGTKETIFKTSHDATDEVHRSTFGAQSRHVSDMGDPDSNYFVLFGGQDGWIGSPAFSDQVPLWRAGKLVKVPLTQQAVAAAHPILTNLVPIAK